MKALLNPAQNNLVIQVEPDNAVFEVASPLNWISCPDNIVAYQYEYVENQFVPYIPPAPTANDNKQTAINLLSQTDWTSVADVGNPQMSNPYLANQAAFISWRSQVRAIAVTPIAGNLDIFNQMPQEVWKSV